MGVPGRKVDSPGSRPATPGDDLAAFLGEVPLLAGVGTELLERLVDAAEIVHLPAGAWLFHQGDAGDTLYVVRSGRLEVVDESGGHERTIGLLERGAALGELALVTGGTRSAGVRARRDSELVTVRREQFNRLLSEEADFAQALIATLGSHLIQTRAAFVQPPLRKKVLTLLPLDAAVPLRALLPPLLEGLAEPGRAAVLERSAISASDTDLVGSAARELDRLEGSHDSVVLVAEAVPGQGEAPDTWTDFCLRQADRVVALITPDTSLPAEPLRGRLSGCDLLVCSPYAAPAARLAPWLDGLSVRSHHQVRVPPPPPGAGRAARVDTATPAMARGAARAGRRLSGRSVGVVLSGGGARGYAHIGVLAAIEAAGIRIDRVGGTSMGALIAALYAVGYSPAQIHRICRAELAERRPFADYGLPRHGLIRGRRGGRMLERIFAGRHAEELQLDWFAVSCDLKTAELVVHRRGSVAVAVGASISLPGFVPPARVDGRLLVDGGALDNLPCDVMAEQDEGPVIAVDVMRRWGDALGDRLPTLREVLACTTQLGSAHVSAANRQLADLVIAPDLRDVGLMDWGTIDSVVERGRSAAEKALAEGWPAG